MTWRAIGTVKFRGERERSDLFEDAAFGELLEEAEEGKGDAGRYGRGHEVVGQAAGARRDHRGHPRRLPAPAPVGSAAAAAKAERGRRGWGGGGRRGAGWWAEGSRSEASEVERGGGRREWMGVET